MAEIIYKGKGFTSIQDRGRFGFRMFGVPISGFLDRQSAWKANWLAGRPLDSPLLETFYTGFEVEFTFDCSVGVSGAAEIISLNGKVVDLEDTLSIKKGDSLRIDKLGKGQISYVAVSADLKTNRQLDSFSTYVPSKIGGNNGRLLANGDIIKVENERVNQPRKLPVHWKYFIPENVTLRYIEGPEYDFLTRESLEDMHHQTFVISNKSDRMGFRTEGNKLEMADDCEIRSSPVVPGTIQLPPSGYPIFIMNDGQTTGGYPRIGTIVSSDLCDLAQMKPGSKIRLKKISIREAKEIYKSWHKKFFS